MSNNTNSNNKKQKKAASKTPSTIANAATPSDMNRPADFLDYLVGAGKFVSYTLPNKFKEVKQKTQEAPKMKGKAKPHQK